MKTQRNILIAFLLNLFFSLFEIVGGIFTNSIAILSDAIHDFGDALSIGISYFLEKKSTKNPDDAYTYGYARYSTLGALISTSILFLGSLYVILNGISRILNPQEINYNGMILLAIIGVIVNLVAVFFTKDGESLNQKAVNLHMFEDVLGWIVVLIGSMLMKITNISIIDPIMSIAVAIYILIHVIENFKEIFELFLEKVPANIDVTKIKEQISSITGILSIHSLHIWSLSDSSNYATLHAVITNHDISADAKREIKNLMLESGIQHVTIETELSHEICDDKSSN